MNGREVRWRWLNSRGQCGVKGNRLRDVSWVTDQRREGWDHRVLREVVTLRLHRSEDVHILQTERDKITTNSCFTSSLSPAAKRAILHYTPQLLEGVTRQHNYSTEPYNLKISHIQVKVHTHKQSIHFETHTTQEI